MPSPTPKELGERGSLLRAANHSNMPNNKNNNVSRSDSPGVSQSSLDEMPSELPAPKSVNFKDKRHRFSLNLGSIADSLSDSLGQGLADLDSDSPVVASLSKIFPSKQESVYDGNGNVTKSRRHTVAMGGAEAAEMKLKRKKIRELRRRRLEDDIVTINCSGGTWQIKRKLLHRYPDTLLGSPALEKYWRNDIQCYFFDRNRDFFEHVIQFYTCGKLNVLKEMDQQVVKFELQFFNLLHPKEQSVSSLSMASTFASELDLTWRQKLFTFLNDPKLNLWSTIYTVFDVMMVCTAVLIMIFETDSDLMPDAHVKGSYWFEIVHMLDIVFMFFFSFDFLLRIISWPTMNTYLTSGMNIVDIVALAPYYVQHGVDIMGIEDSMELIVLFRIARLLRIVRVFRFIRHSEELFQICYFVFNVRSQLGVLYFFSHMIILVFGTLMYYVEGGAEFSSILESCWWAVATLSTLGYGDKVPRGTAGCVVGGVAVIIGMVILSLPMTIVVSKFAQWYEDEKDKINVSHNLKK